MHSPAGAESPPLSRPSWQDVIAYLRLAVTLRDDVALERIINVPKRQLGPAAIARLKELAKAQVGGRRPCRRVYYSCCSTWWKSGAGSGRVLQRLTGPMWGCYAHAGCRAMILFPHCLPACLHRMASLAPSWHVPLRPGDVAGLGHCLLHFSPP